jgi:hypothetical protein
LFVQFHSNWRITRCVLDFLVNYARGLDTPPVEPKAAPGVI